MQRPVVLRLPDILSCQPRTRSCGRCVPVLLLLQLEPRRYFSAPAAPVPRIHSRRTYLRHPSQPSRSQKSFALSQRPRSRNRWNGPMTAAAEFSCLAVSGKMAGFGGFRLSLRKLALLKPVDDAAGNDQLLHFRGALINAQGPDFAIQALDRLFADHALAAKNLHGSVDHLLCGFGGSHFRHCRRNCNVLPLVTQPCSAISKQRGSIDSGGHLRELGLCQLKIGQRLPEHFARSRSTQTLIEGSARESNRRGRAGSAKHI